MKPATGARSALLARAAGGAAAAALLTAAGLAGAPAASASDQFLQLSLDGINYGSTAAGAVFANGVRYVPGGSSSGSLWVRNAGPEKAHLSVAAVTTQMDPELFGAVVMERAVDQASDEPRTLLGDAGSCVDLGIVELLEPGETIKLGFKAGLLAEAANQTRNKEMQFDFRLLLDAADSGGRSACTGAVPIPGKPAAVPAGNPAPPASSRNAGVAVVTGTAVALPISGGAAARPAAERSGDWPKRVGEAALPVPASFIESTVEPVTRTLVGTLLIAVSVLFCGVVYRRTSTTRRTS